MVVDKTEDAVNAYVLHSKWSELKVWVFGEGGTVHQHYNNNFIDAISAYFKLWIAGAHVLWFWSDQEI